MIPVLKPRQPVTFAQANTPCEYRYCHAPNEPMSATDVGLHTSCFLARMKLESNALATHSNSLRVFMKGRLWIA